MTLSLLSSRRLSLSLAMTALILASAPAQANDANSPLFMLNQITSQVNSLTGGQAAPSQNTNAVSENLAQANAATAEAQAIAAMTPQQRTEYLARKHGGQGAGNIAAIAGMLTNQGNAGAQPASNGAAITNVLNQALQTQNTGAASANLAQANATAAEAQAIAAMTPQQRTEYLARKHGGQGAGNIAAIAGLLTNQGNAGAQPSSNGAAITNVLNQALQTQNTGAASANLAQANAATAEAQAIAAMTPQQRTEYLARKHGGQGAGNIAAIAGMLTNQGNTAAPAVPAGTAAQQQNAPAALLNGLLGGIQNR